jgi:hypothetical protein
MLVIYLLVCICTTTNTTNANTTVPYCYCYCYCYCLQLRHCQRRHPSLGLGRGVEGKGCQSLCRKRGGCQLLHSKIKIHLLHLLYVRFLICLQSCDLFVQCFCRLMLALRVCSLSVSYSVPVQVFWLMYDFPISPICSLNSFSAAFPISFTNSL